jgi:hypothetical protein
MLQSNNSRARGRRGAAAHDLAHPAACLVPVIRRKIAPSVTVTPRKAEVVMATRRNADLPRSPDPGAPQSSDTLGSDSSPATRSPTEVCADARELMIARAAYVLAEARGFAPGHDLEDWFAAQAEVDAVLAAAE